MILAISCVHMNPEECVYLFFDGFLKQNSSFKITMSGQAGGRTGGRASDVVSVNLLVNLFSKFMLPLFFSGLLSYLVKMKKRTSRRVLCKRDNSHFYSLCTYLP